MGRLGSIFKFIRLRDQIFIILAVIIANFLLSFSLSISLLSFLFFIFSVTSFTFVVNDISDINIDRLNKKSDNPIIRKEISLPLARVLSISFFILSIISAFFLPVNLLPFSIILIFISLTYSFFIKAKSRPPLDLIYHGLSPAIIFLMISSFYTSLNHTIFLSSLIIFNMFLIIQLLQEIRDFDSDKKFIKTTAIILGIKNSIKLSIILLGSLILIVLVGIVIFAFPIRALLYFPLSYLLFNPLFVSLKNKKYEKDILSKFRKRLIITTLIFFGLFLFLSFL